MGTPDTVEALDANAAAAHRAEWQALAANATEPNAFYEPAITLAAMKHLSPDTKVLMARREGKLIGVWPVVWRKRRFVVPLPLMAVQPSYAPITTPLLDKSHAEAAATALLSWIWKQGASALLVPKLSSAGTAAKALENAARNAGVGIAKLNTHKRAALQSEAHLSSRTLSRMRRRLEDTGNLTVDIVSAPDQAKAALEEYLALEHAGWKAGSSLASRANEAAFIRDVIPEMAKTGQARVAMMRRDGKPVAGGIVFSSAGRAYFFKSSYREDIAKFSPGGLLAEDVTRDLLADTAISSGDSLADAGHDVIERIWPDRMEISDCIIAPDDSTMFRLIVALEKAFGSARGAAKKVLRR